MKSVMISIQPKWCELIVSGKKNVEVRKSAPKLEPPFKVYIYCSKGKDRLLDIIRDGDSVFGCTHHGKPVFIKTPESSFRFGNSGKVIAEFTCYRTIPFLMLDNEPLFLQAISGLRSYLTKDEVAKYIGKKYGYLWQISNLRVYEKPMELTDFYKPCISPEFMYCPNCPVGGEYISESEYEVLAMDGECSTEWYCNNRLRRPPQSWCYVEELQV